MKSVETEDLQQFQKLTNQFAGRLFDYASMLEMQYLLSHIYNLQRAIQEKLNADAEAREGMEPAVPEDNTLETFSQKGKGIRQ